MNAEFRETEFVAAQGQFKKPLRHKLTEADLRQMKPFHHLGQGAKKSTGILFLHGFTSTPASMGGFINALLEMDYSISAPLLPGHGTTAADLIGIAWQDWLKAAEQAYDHLASSCERVIAIGFSLGAALSLQLSTTRKVHRVALIAPAVFPNWALLLMCHFIGPTLRLFGAQFWPQHIGGDIKKEGMFEICYRRVALDAFRELYRCMRATEALLPRVTTDVLILQGRIDHEVPAGKAPEIIAALGSSRKELVWLENSFHGIPCDNDAELALNKIKAFIEE